MSYKKFGIDISKWQGDFDLDSAVSDYGVEFVIIKAGGGDSGLYTDTKFNTNYKKAVSADIYKGAYFYGNATDVETAEDEAAYFAELLAGKQFELPVYYDVESDDMLALSKSELTTIVKAFCDKMEDLGFYVGIYMSYSNWMNAVNDDDLTDYAHWIAQWAKTCSYEGTYGMWQFGGSTNKINDTEINGQTVDQDYMLIDYPSVITAGTFNGYSSDSDVSEVKDDTDVVTDEEVTDKASIVQGAKFTANKVNLYASSTSTTAANTITGTYYIWNATIKKDRVRVTNNKDYCGKAAKVTGWVNVDDIIDSDATETTYSSLEEDGYTAGDSVTLSSVALYASSTATKKAKSISGTYYIWNNTIKNGRVRITNTKARVGVTGQVTGWINVSDI